MSQIIRDDDIKSDQEIFNVQLVQLSEPIIIKDESTKIVKNKVFVKCIIIIIIMIITL
jgi:hypothetical protein